MSARLQASFSALSGAALVIVCITVWPWHHGLCIVFPCGCFVAPGAPFGRHTADHCVDHIPGESCQCLPEHTRIEQIGSCRRGERIAFSYLISQKYTGESAKLDILRGGEELSITVPLDRPHPLVPIHLDDKQPSYLVVAGMVSSICLELCMYP